MVVTLPSLTATWHNTTYPAIDPTQAHLSAKGKAVLITGGGRGIGARVARSFAAAGASLITITGRTRSSLESSKAALESEFSDTKILIAEGDVADEAAMDSAFAALSKANDGIGVDICIHNAGYLPTWCRPHRTGRDFRLVVRLHGQRSRFLRRDSCFPQAQEHFPIRRPCASRRWQRHSLPGPAA